MLRKRKSLTTVAVLALAVVSVGAVALAQGTNSGQRGVDVTIPVGGATILHYEEFVLGTNMFTDALSNLGLDGETTFTSDPGEFDNLIGSQSWDCIIAMHSNTSDGSAAFADSFEAYVVGGGRAIYTDWTLNSSGLTSLYDAFEVAGTGAINTASMVTDGDPIWAGVGSPVSFANPGWGIYAYDLSPQGGGIGSGTMDAGGAAVVIGNGRATAFNGFIHDTWASSGDAVTFAENEINGICFGAVPATPGLWPIALLLLLLVPASWILIRRQQNAH